jgi:hypothetical protein
MLAEVAQLDVARDEVTRRLRDHDLAAMSCGGDAGRAVNVDPDVAFVDRERLAGVDADPHAQGAFPEGALPFVRGFDGIGRPRERVEEGVALRVDLGAAALGELGTKNPSMLREDSGVLVTELLEQRGRALDVGEEEGDRAGRQGRIWDRLGRSDRTSNRGAPSAWSCRRSLASGRVAW